MYGGGTVGAGVVSGWVCIIVVLQLQTRVFRAERSSQTKNQNCALWIRTRLKQTIPRAVPEVLLHFHWLWQEQEQLTLELYQEEDKTSAHYFV